MSPEPVPGSSARGASLTASDRKASRMQANRGSPLTDSNRRPPPYHGGALPTELRGQAGKSSPDMVGAMRARRTLTVVGCHAGGEIGNVVAGGVLPPDGATVFAPMQTPARRAPLR